MARQHDAQAVRFAVIGQGHFAQTAILPAFATAKNSKLVALFSNDPSKLAELKRSYRVKDALPYERFDDYLQSGEVDAVYIALPNDMHCQYTERAASRGVHVLCEKPMAVTSAECQRMIAACDRAKVKLMVAYRLHFEEANLTAVEIVNGGRLGEPRFFTSGFSQQVVQGIRTSAERGGGPMYDIGIYCINAARYLFRAEPTDVMAFAARRAGDERFREVDEQMSVVMRFPGERLAAFVCGFGGAKENYYDVVCTDGRVRLDPAYHHAMPLRLDVMPGKGKPKSKRFKKRDQVAAEITYFARCVLDGKDPEPSGLEGLADVCVIEAVHRSAQEHKVVPVERIPTKAHPSAEQAESQQFPGHGKPGTVHTGAPTR
jgi:predicted dehydrogenase